MADLRADDFEPLVGQSFDADGIAAFTLTAVQRGPHQPGAPREHPFTLLFEGPPDLGHRTLDLTNAAFAEPLMIYLSEYGAGRYEAVFN